MVSLVVFGENLVYRVGGTEKSTRTLVRELSRNPNLDVRVVSGSRDDRYGDARRYEYDDCVAVPLRGPRPLPFLRAHLNARAIGSEVRRRPASLLLANAQAAPLAMNAFDGPSVYFLRDEMSLHSYRTYETRIVKRIKFAGRYVLDYPFFRRYQHMNRKAIRDAALVVADSAYMARRAERMFGRRVATVYPLMDLEALSRIELAPVERRPHVMMVGDDEVKGLSVFRKIAEALPEHEFLIVGRTLENRTVGNLTQRSYASDPVDLYGWARLILCPSVWEECFGMAVVEAGALGIPGLVSARGGLPETVPASYYTVPDHRSVDRWVEKIRHVLHDYERHSRTAKAHALRFDMRRQLAVLAREVLTATGIDLGVPIEPPEDVGERRAEDARVEAERGGEEARVEAEQGVEQVEAEREGEEVAADREGERSDADREEAEAEQERVPATAETEP